MLILNFITKLPKKSIALLTVITILMAGTTFASQSKRIETPRSELDIRFVEWIPLYANTQIYQKLEEGLTQGQGHKVRLQRKTIFGDVTQLAELLKEFDRATPDMIITIGDYVSRYFREKRPDLPQIAVLIEDPAALHKLHSSTTTNLVTISTRPTAAQVWALAKTLNPEGATLGIIYTDTYKPNATLSSALAKLGVDKNLRVSEIKVNPGFCRTESDFRLAIQDAYKAKTFDVLFVPRDPNCDRFGTTIFQAATALKVPSIGTDSTFGKGCRAALTRNYDAIAARISQTVNTYQRGGAFPVSTCEIAPTVVKSEQEFDAEQPSNSSI